MMLREGQPFRRTMSCTSPIFPACKELGRRAEAAVWKAGAIVAQA